MTAVARDPAGVDPKVLADLVVLVGCDTQNPPRAPRGFFALFDHVEAALKPLGFSLSRRDLGDGCVWLHARRGDGGPLVNVHVDTVPAAEGWRGSPHALTVADGVAVGLGACDTKGALAAFLQAARQTHGAVELLLTSDEEAGQSRCVRAFCLEQPVRDRLVIVAEPTRMQAVLAHRGIGTCVGVFSGTPGHGSLARAITDNANHEAARWAARVLGFVEHADIRFNLGVVEGGVKPNMISGSCRVRFGVRPPPGMNTTDVVDALCSLADHPDRVRWTPGYIVPPLMENARADAERLRATIGAPVEFFTEAALFQQAGARAFVIGPGDIADAHAADEVVALGDLALAVEFYTTVCGSVGIR